MQKTTVGWKEHVALPGLNLNLECKVDTGAKNSALHAFDVHSFRKKGKKWVRFSIHTNPDNLEEFVECEAEVIDTRPVTNSGGVAQKRYFIKTELHIGEDRFPVEMSLTRRDNMAFRMLLGRTALRKGNFLVDSSAEYLKGKPK
ncbi:ATP-dependent zinc protease [Thiomicrorhabdus sediminis]|uniref:ATP-dependent zinc protease n=1 Tax=Thiomicrorhabdus sediminis TaxID=2580412 RepID=A0A4P9K4S1_9GAMM|nr:ATP-dependent zinc protease [Thiomicrorhabdus sediminis]QCU89942.1 ATP-dependent zinc protease [Thiomicrorhabdus sediminis]